MKCYLVSVTVEILVVAQNGEEARNQARYALSDEAALIEPKDYESCLAHHIPAPWTEKCLVYHSGKDDINVKAALSLNKT